MFFPLSLTARVTLTAVAAIFVGLGLFAMHMLAVLQRDLTGLIGTQLAAQVEYVVADMDEEFGLRTRLLEEIASAITPALLADPSRLQRLLDQRSPSDAVFPNGMVVTDKDGRVIAQYPSDNPAFRQGNLGDRGYFHQLMAENRPQIGPPALGRFFGKPIVVVAVPIHDQYGAAAGMLAGPAVLSDADLFGRLETARLGQSGKLLVMSTRDNLMVAATAKDKTRVMQALPPRGANPLLDRRRDEGFEGAGVTVDSLGVEVVSVSRRMKTTGWMVAASMSTEEALASANKFNRHTYVAAPLIALVVALVLVFVLLRQLAPLQQAGKKMQQMTDGEARLAPLAVGRQDEIGKVVVNFNRLLTDRLNLEEEILDINKDLEAQVLKRTEMLREANLGLEEQIGERKAAEAAALDYADRLQTMSRQLIVVQEEERRHLARELHDRVSSGLSAIGLELKVIGGQLSEDTLVLLHEHLSDCTALLEDTQASARDISADLHPAILDYAGLYPALEDFGKKFARRSGISVDLSQSGQTVRLPADKELALFRIAQEALANCAKHSHAKSVAIRFAHDEANQRVELAISDDGLGFDTSQLSRRGPDKSIGLGLLAMQERAEAIGGKCRIESTPGKGTRVIVDVRL